MKSKRKNNDNAVAGIGGATSGGILLYLLSIINIENEVLLNLFTYSVPAISVALAGFISYVRKSANKKYQAYIIQFKQRQLRSTIEKYLEDPNTSENHKNELRQKLERLKQEEIDSKFAKLKELKLHT